MRKTLKKVVKRVFLFSLMAVFVAAASTPVRAAYYVGKQSDGDTVWVTCGGTGQNYFWECPAGGGACYSNPVYDSKANAYCSLQ